MTKYFRTAVIALAGLIASSGVASEAAAQTQPSFSTGTITSVMVADGQNYGFRVHLTNNGSDPLSNCADDFAYVNTTHDNYQVLVGSMMLGYYQHKTVTLTIFNENGFCRIDEANVS